MNLFWKYHSDAAQIKCPFVHTITWSSLTIAIVSEHVRCRSFLTIPTFSLPQPSMKVMKKVGQVDFFLKHCISAAQIKCPFVHTAAQSSLTIARTFERCLCGDFPPCTYLRCTTTSQDKQQSWLVTGFILQGLHQCSPNQVSVCPLLLPVFTNNCKSVRTPSLYLPSHYTQPTTKSSGKGWASGFILEVLH